MPPILKSILTLLITLLCFSCSEKEDPVNDPAPREETTSAIYKTTKTTFTGNEKIGTVITYFEFNRPVIDSVFDGYDQFRRKRVFYYTGEGLQNHILTYDDAENVSSEILIGYEQDKISSITWSETTLNGTITHTDQITYSGTEAKLERFDEQNNTIYQITYTKNHDGLITKQDNGQSIVELELQAGLPVTKRTIQGGNETLISYTYLETPAPKAPWSQLGENQLGNYNNQVIFHFDGGLFDIVNRTDLKKYLSSHSNYVFSYHFNSFELPEIIEESNGERTLQTLIEYIENP